MLFKLTKQKRLNAQEIFLALIVSIIIDAITYLESRDTPIKTSKPEKIITNALHKLRVKQKKRFQ